MSPELILLGLLIAIAAEAYICRQRTRQRKNPKEKP